LKFTIHRGTQEIGGSCVEVWTDTTRLVIDLGMPLVGLDQSKFESRSIEGQNIDELRQQGILPNIEGLYKGGGTVSLILSHAHQDHYGLMNYIHDSCPVYLGEATHRLVELTNLVLNKKWSIKNPQHFRSGESFRIGNIDITPFLMDHSAFDAYAFLIEADGNSIFYSGDFRTHGRKAGAIKWLEKKVKPDIDYLLLEGTTIGRSDIRMLSEDEIETEFTRTFKETDGLNLVYSSGQNIDRLVSIYRACIKANKTLAVDFYIANVLKELAAFAKVPYPSKEYPKISVFYPYRLSRMISRQGNANLLYRFRSFKITRDQIDEKHRDIVMIVRPSMKSDLELMKNLDGATFTYSLWSGYKKEGATKEFIEYLTSRGVAQKSIHTSGHADRAGLQQMIDILQPKHLVPMHTFEGDQYADIFEEENVLRINDGQVVSC
jgi:ribonuclease J